MNANNYPDVYNDEINKLLDRFKAPLDVKKILKDKRDFGLEKYKELSYQNSLENSMSVDTVQHAFEEIVDLLNYLLHNLYISNLKGKDTDINELLIFKVIDIYSGIEKLR